MLLEFGTLSRLTGNPVYEQKSKHAMKAVYGEAVMSKSCTPNTYVLYFELLN